MNNRLIASKAEIGQALYYAKLTLRVGPYIQVLALLKIFPLLAFINQLYSLIILKLSIKLIKQELQTSNYSKVSPFCSKP
jgi:hypothetical protein